jgi:hypothetical protein
MRPITAPYALFFFLIVLLCLNVSSFFAQESTPEPVPASPTLTVPATATNETAPELTQALVPSDTATIAVATSTDTALLPEVTDAPEITEAATLEPDNTRMVKFQRKRTF